MPLTAAQIITELRQYYCPISAIVHGTDEWSLLTEVSSAGSIVHPADPYGEMKRLPGETVEEQTERIELIHQRVKPRAIDALLVRNWSGKPLGFERIACEVKVSRGDFFRDTEIKRAPWMSLAHRFAYVTPAGLVSAEEVPEGCWLIEVSEEPCEAGSAGHKNCASDGTRVHWNRKVKGRKNIPEPIPVQLSVMFARLASRAEAKILHAQEDDTDTDSLMEDLRVAKRRIAQLEVAVVTAKNKMKAITDVTAPLTKQECADCGEPIGPQVRGTFSRGNYAYYEWKHVERAAAEACMRNLGVEYTGFYEYGVVPKVLRDLAVDMDGMQ